MVNQSQSISSESRISFSPWFFFVSGQTVLLRMCAACTSHHDLRLDCASNVTHHVARVDYILFHCHQPMQTPRYFPSLSRVQPLGLFESTMILSKGTIQRAESFAESLYSILWIRCCISLDCSSIFLYSFNQMFNCVFLIFDSNISIALLDCSHVVRHNSLVTSRCVFHFRQSIQLVPSMFLCRSLLQ